MNSCYPIRGSLKPTLLREYSGGMLLAPGMNIHNALKVKSIIKRGIFYRAADIKKMKKLPKVLLKGDDNIVSQKALEVRMMYSIPSLAWHYSVKNAGKMVTYQVFFDREVS